LLSGDGRFVNGKRTGRVNELKATYDPETQSGKWLHIGDPVKIIESVRLSDLFE
jgi:hypothetical protein